MSLVQAFRGSIVAQTSAPAWLKQAKEFPSRRRGKVLALFRGKVWRAKARRDMWDLLIPSKKTSPYPLLSPVLLSR